MKHIFSTIALCGLLAMTPAILGGQTGFTARAQDNVTVSGTVVDESGEPMLGAGVVVKGTTTGTTVDLDGNFSLRTNATAGSLVFSMMGMTEQEKFIFNLRYVLRMLKDESYSRKELIKEFEQELQHSKSARYSVAS